MADARAPEGCGRSQFQAVAPIEVPELGAPHGASWDGFLRQHKIQFLFVAALARAIGLFQAANSLPLAAAVLAALSFYGVSRYFRARPEWALMGASAFCAVSVSVSSARSAT